MISILIPTYNRCTFLENNLKNLVSIINKKKLKEKIEIVISNNNSSDDTKNMVLSFIKNTNIDIRLINQTENIGAVRNIIEIVNYAQKEFFVFCGDDDYISEKYLVGILELLRNNKNVSCIIPSYQNCTSDMKLLEMGRDLNKKTKYYKKGFKNIFYNSWRGHQISGLVFKTDIVKRLNNEYNVNNFYQQIFYVIYFCYHYDTIHYTDFPILVTRPGQENKDWDYDETGLISNVFINYNLLDELGVLKKSILQLYFLDRQYWRYAMFIKQGPYLFLKSIYKIIINKETLILTKICFFILWPFILFFKSLNLILSGKLVKSFKMLK